MDAKCPKCFGKKTDCESCKGSGFVAVTFAEGVWYSRDCLDCKMHIGVTIVGEQGAKIEDIQRHPEDMVCCFCDGQAVFTAQEEPDNADNYRLPLEYEPPRFNCQMRKISSQRLSRPRRCLSHRLKCNKKVMKRISKIFNG